jgi:hypothetical protein
MKSLRSLSLTLALGLAALGAAVPAAAQTPLGASPSGAWAGTLSSVAYDDKHGVYLHVWEYHLNGGGIYDIYGRFIGANGALLGAPFVISTGRLSFGVRPKVAYSRGSSADVFLVTFDSDPVKVNQAGVFGQLVQYTGSGATAGAFVGSAFPISPNSLVSGPAGTYQGSSDVAFNPQTSQFAVAWEEFAGGSPDVYVRLFTTAGGAATGPVNASPGGGGQYRPAIAYDWSSNKFLVAYYGDSPANGALGTYGYLLNGSTAQPVSSLLTIGSGYTIEPALAYLPEAGGFLAAWTQVLPNFRVSNARFIASSTTSAIANAEFVAMSASLPVGAPSMAYDYVSRQVLMASMRSLGAAPWGTIAGSVLNAFGASPSATFNIATVPAAISGTYYPTVVAASSGLFGMSYINDLSTAQFERFQLPAAGTPGPSFDCGSNCTPPPPPPPPPPPTDTDGDGVPDSQDSCPSVFAQTANGCPVVPATVNGDFNADGKPELVWQNVGAPGQVYSWFLNSNLTFASGTYLVNENVPAGWTVVGTSDFTGDGKPDVLYQNQTTGQLVLFVMNGTTKVGEQVLGASPAWRVVATGDFNGDGKTDLVWQNFAAGQIYIWFMTSSGGVATTMNPFQGAYLMDAGMNVITIGDKNWRVVGVADLNGDHKLDLVWQHSTGNLAAYYMNGTIATGAIDVSLNDPTWKVRAVGDYNLDGHPDLIFQNIVNGQIAAWLLTGANGATLLGSANVGTVNLVWTLSGPR